MHPRLLISTLLLGAVLGPLGLAGQEPSPQDAGTVSSVCGTAAGTRFNLEPRTNAQIQVNSAIDFLRNRVSPGIDLIVGASATTSIPMRYYASRDADCTPEFEGPFPTLSGFSSLGWLGVAADPARDAVFMADKYEIGEPDFEKAVGIFRSPASTLLNPTACPNGTHTAAQAATCWPTQKLLLASTAELFNPHLAVDERVSGTGAGNVYVAVTQSGIQLVVCTNTLASCSAPLLISGSDADPQLPHVATRPDGRITITWANVIASSTSEIKYRSCTPAGAPAPPTCGAISLVSTETQALPGFASSLWPYTSPVTTHPKHAHRVDANGTETYVVWDRCKVPLIGGFTCPDADVVLKASNNNGATWSALTCLSCFTEHQFLSTIKTDRSRNIVNIAFYSSGGDPTFQRRVQVFIRHINPGGATPDPSDPHTITTLLNDLEAGSPGNNFFGQFIGVAARGTGADGGSRVYVHYSYDNIQGIYNGVQVPDKNNHLSRLDY